MREALRQIGRQALGMLLSGLQKTPEREIACACGGSLHYQRKRTATVISVFGRVQKRAYYAGCKCQQGKAPLDEQYGLEPGAVTRGAIRHYWRWQGLPFRMMKVPRWLETYLLFDVAENTVRSETEQMGALQAQQEEDDRTKPA